MLFQKYVAQGQHQRMAGMQHGGKGRTRLVERADSFARETHPLVTPEHWCEFTAITAGD